MAAANAGTGGGAANSESAGGRGRVRFLKLYSVGARCEQEVQGPSEVSWC